MLKKSIGIGLLCLTGQVYANVNITTTEDVVRDDAQCSIREAVTYISKYVTVPANESAEDKEAREKIKKAGYFGCGSDSSNNYIVLEENKVYTLKNEIVLPASMQFQTAYNQFTSEGKPGLNNATIKAEGNHRLFTIFDGDADISQISVQFVQVNLEGCASKNICAEQGGIIFNRETVSFDYVILKNGFANAGGAIYSEGVLAASGSGAANSVTMRNSILQGNKATQGAALFIAQPLYKISNSVIRDNVASGENASVIYVERPTTAIGNNIAYTASIVNSTIFKNSGYIANLLDGLYVNNVTAVDNQKGFQVQSFYQRAYLSNSIIANNSENCKNNLSNRILSFNNLVGDQSCGLGENNNKNTILTDIEQNKIFASKDNRSIGENGKEISCDLAPAEGLLCPFKTPKESFLGYFKPRLLVSYNTVYDSPIVNRGRAYSDGTDQGLYRCENNDQRGLVREAAVHCDLGAVELSLGIDNIVSLGQSILYGQIAEMSILDSLADGDLWPASECEAILGKTVDGQPWKAGCLRIEQSASTPVSKGHTTLDKDGSIKYVPKYNFHGLDQFKLKVMTTVSRFSDAEKDRDIAIDVKIVSDPVHTFKSDKINVSGGGIGGVGLLGLLLLAFGRKYRH